VLVPNEQRPSCAKFFCDQCDDAQQCEQCFERICGPCNTHDRLEVSCERCGMMLCVECDCGCDGDPPSTCVDCGGAVQVDSIKTRVECAPGFSA